MIIIAPDLADLEKQISAHERRFIALEYAALAEHADRLPVVDPFVRACKGMLAQYHARMAAKGREMRYCFV